MSTRIIDGKAISKELETQFAAEVEALAENLGRPPALALIEVGKNPESASYLKIKRSRARKIGIAVRELAFDADAEAERIIDGIAQLNTDPEVDGILLQLPLPEHLDAQALLSKIDPAKDVDGLHPLNLGYLCAGLPCLSPPTPQACVLLAREARTLLSESSDLSGLHVVVVGRSLLVGKPTAMLFTHENASVTLLHSKSRSIEKHCKSADILVVACGVQSLLGEKHIKKDAIVIDVGMHWQDDGSVCGDVDVSGIEGLAAVRSPVPGGVGPLTVTMLLGNVIKAWKHS